MKPLHSLGVIFLVVFTLATDSEAKEPPHPIIDSYKIKNAKLYLVAFWIPKDTSKKVVTEAEFFMLPDKIVRECKGKTRATCSHLKRVFYQTDHNEAKPVRISWFPKKEWNYGEEFDDMMRVVKPKKSKDLRKRLHKWIVEKIPKKHWDGSLPGSLKGHVHPYGFTVGSYPRIQSVKPFEAVVLEVVYESVFRDADQEKEKGFFILDLKI